MIFSASEHQMTIIIYTSWRLLGFFFMNIASKLLCLQNSIFSPCFGTKPHNLLEFQDTLEDLISCTKLYLLRKYVAFQLLRLQPKALFPQE